MSVWDFENFLRVRVRPTSKCCVRREPSAARWFCASEPSWKMRGENQTKSLFPGGHDGWEEAVGGDCVLLLAARRTRYRYIFFPFACEKRLSRRVDPPCLVSPLQRHLQLSVVGSFFPPLSPSLVCFLLSSFYGIDFYNIDNIDQKP